MILSILITYLLDIVWDIVMRKTMTIYLGINELITELFLMNWDLGFFGESKLKQVIIDDVVKRRGIA